MESVRDYVRTNTNNTNVYDIVSSALKCEGSSRCVLSRLGMRVVKHHERPPTAKESHVLYIVTLSDESQQAHSVSSFLSRFGHSISMCHTTLGSRLFANSGKPMIGDQDLKNVGIVGIDMHEQSYAPIEGEPGEHEYVIKYTCDEVEEEKIRTNLLGFSSIRAAVGHVWYRLGFKDDSKFGVISSLSSALRGGEGPLSNSSFSGVQLISNSQTQKPANIPVTSVYAIVDNIQINNQNQNCSLPGFFLDYGADLNESFFIRNSEKRRNDTTSEKIVDGMENGTLACLKFRSWDAENGGTNRFWNTCKRSCLMVATARNICIGFEDMIVTGICLWEKRDRGCIVFSLILFFKGVWKNLSVSGRGGLCSSIMRTYTPTKALLHRRTGQHWKSLFKSS